MLNLCHHEPGRPVAAYLFQNVCTLCGEVVPEAYFQEPAQDPHVVYPTCKCPKCVAGRAKQKDRLS